MLIQAGNSWIVTPVKGNESVVDFYDFYNMSGHTPFMESHVSKIYLYQDLLTDELSLVMHQGIDNDTSGTMKAIFDFVAIPEGAYVSVSDEPQGLGSSHRSPHLAEFDLSLEPEAYWANTYNSDGGALSGLPVNSVWNITIIPTFIQQIHSWKYVLGNETEIELQMNETLHVASLYESPYDLNLDGKIDMKDIGVVAQAYGTYPGHERWNQIADITGEQELVPDDNVNMRDVALIARNFGSL
jgi:hypothetical protein